MKYFIRNIFIIFLTITYLTPLFSTEADEQHAIETAQKEIASFKLSTQTFATGSVDQIENWHENLRSMQKVAYDSIIKKHNLDDSVAKRIVASVVTNSVASWVSYQSSLTMHEGAHGRAATEVGATGITYQSAIDGSNTGESLTLGELFLTVLSGQGTGGARTSYYLPQGYTPEDRLVIAAAGLNSQTGLSEKLVHDAWEKKSTHFLDTLPYMINKLAITSYAANVDPELSGNDLQNYLDNLIEAGHLAPDQKENAYAKLKNLSIFSALLSGGMWQGVLSEVNYIVNGKETVKLLGISTPYGLISLPEFSTYLNKDNISLKGEIAFFPKNTLVERLTLSLEDGVIGDCCHSEIGLGVKTSMGNFDSLTKVVVGSDNSYGISQKLEYNVNKKLSVYGEVSYDTGTMDGNRHCYSPNGEPCVQAHVGIEYHFFTH